jgi:hypothetical protein
MIVEIIKPIQGKAYFEGDVIELPDDQAMRLIEGGFCVESKKPFVFPTDLSPSPQGEGRGEGGEGPETAESKIVPEKAVLKSGKKKA